MHIVIYSWHTRTDFLLQTLFPDAQIIVAQPRVDDARIIELARQIKAAHPQQSLYWFFQINLSYSQQWLCHPVDTLAQLSKLGFVLCNEHVTDITKRWVHTLNRVLGLNSVTVHRQDCPAELPVMVKSNYNYGGEFESILDLQMRQALGLASSGGCEIREFNDYYQTTVAQLDSALWEDERIVVERYIENLDQRFYRFYRCGDHAVLSEVINVEVIKKMKPGLPRQNWCFKFMADTNHRYQVLINNASLMMQTMQMDFGAIDVVMDDQGNDYMIDVNQTPGWGKEVQGEVLAFLRQGIRHPQLCTDATAG